MKKQVLLWKSIIMKESIIFKLKEKLNKKNKY